MKKSNQLEVTSEEEASLIQTLQSRIDQKSTWYFFLQDLHRTILTLDNFTIEFSVKRKFIKFWTISFIHQDLEMYETLKKFVWEYGFVVPIKGWVNKKVLKGEKKIKYKNN